MVRAVGSLTLVTLAAGLLMAFGVAPREVTQGNVQRIMYLHVPSVWVAYLAFAVVLVASIVYLARRNAEWVAVLEMEQPSRMAFAPAIAADLRR